MPARSAHARQVGTLAFVGRSAPFEVDQRSAQQVLRLAKAGMRAADGRKAVGQQRQCYEPGVGAEAVADRRIGLARLEIDRIVGRMQAQIPARVQRAEAGGARHQQLGRERHGGRKRREPPGRLPPYRFHGLGHRVEGPLQRRVEGPAFGGQHDLAGLAHEQGDAQAVLELADLVADRGRRHAELGRSLLEASAPSGRLEGTQGAERRQSAHHVTAEFSSSMR